MCIVTHRMHCSNHARHSPPPSPVLRVCDPLFPQPRFLHVHRHVSHALQQPCTALAPTLTCLARLQPPFPPAPFPACASSRVACIAATMHGTRPHPHPSCAFAIHQNPCPRSSSSAALYPPQPHLQRAQPHTQRRHVKKGWRGKAGWQLHCC